MRIEVKKGDTFGVLTIVEEVEKQRLPCGQSVRVFLCRCRCGKEKKLRLLDIRHGKVKSCGCLFNDGRNTKTELQLKKVLRQMISRCKKDYFQSQYYYIKGINVCQEWINDKSSFLDWALSNGYEKGLQIDRINNSKGYEPNNCRWVNITTNMNNKTTTTMVNYNGINYPFMELIRIKGLVLSHDAIRGRINRKWKIEDAFDTPLRIGNYAKKKKHHQKKELN